MSQASTPTGPPQEVDVLVVGAGPGGSATAYHLARHGLDVLLVERAQFPREKVCGDGLTPRAVVALERMGIDTADPGFERVHGMLIYSRRVTLRLPWPSLDSFPDYGLVRTRSDFDELLARRAEKAGARLHEGTEAVEPILDGGWVRGARIRPTDGDEVTEVRARFVVAADGAAGRFAAPAGVRRDARRPLGIAARRYYRIPREPVPWLEVWMDLWEGDLMLPGYGWLFPLPGGSVNLVAGLLNTFTNFKDVSAQRVFDAFARSLPSEWEVGEDTAEGEMRSGPLPMGFNRGPAVRLADRQPGDHAVVDRPRPPQGAGDAVRAPDVGEPDGRAIRRSPGQADVRARAARAGRLRGAAMLSDYLPIVILAALAFVFAVLSLAASALLRPSRPTPAKLAPYECGIEPERL